MEKKVGIFIPARLQSERLPNKLMLPLNDKKLSLFEIACKKLKYLSKTYKCYALINDEQLINIARMYDVEVIIRNPHTCEVDGPMTYIFGDLKDKIDHSLTHLTFLNPCLYNLSVETIENAIAEFVNSPADSGTSVKEIKNWVWTEKGKALIPADYKRLSTKEIHGYYQAAHCFHIFSVENFFKTGNMLDENHSLILVDKLSTLDVDDETEYELAKVMLPKLRKKFVVDIDGTICTQEKDYRDAKPLQFNIDKLQKLDANGHTILYFTARGTETGIDWKSITLAQLRNWGCPQYENLQFGKPSADFYIDDKALPSTLDRWF
jgi:CMP-N-acetylneuraminic acid synthetase